MDIPFARKVLEFVENEHSDFTHRQATFYWDAALEKKHQLMGANFCGTTACISGAACILSPDAQVTYDKHEGMMVEMDGQTLTWCEAGRQLLGIDSGQMFDLFLDYSDSRAINKLRDMITAAEVEEAAQL